MQGYMKDLKTIFTLWIWQNLRTYETPPISFWAMSQIQPQTWVCVRRSTNFDLRPRGVCTWNPSWPDENGGHQSNSSAGKRVWRDVWLRCEVYSQLWKYCWAKGKEMVPGSRADKGIRSFKGIIVLRTSLGVFPFRVIQIRCLDKRPLRTFALIVFAHPYCACKFECHPPTQARDRDYSSRVPCQHRTIIQV